MRSEAHHARGRGIAAAAAAVVFVVIAAASAWIWASRDAVPPQLPADSSADVHALAVLPFENTGGAPEDDYFSDGMTDELAHALARLPGIRLAGRTSSYAFKGRAVPAQQIGRELDVGAFISGTVRRAGDRIRVTAQLVSVRDGKVIQEAASETSTGDVFAVQDALTSSIVAAIAPALAAGRPPDAGSRGTADQEAYDLYLKGRHLYVARGADNLERSIHFFRRAVERDPNFARAHAGLAMAYTVLGVYAAGAADSALRLRAESARRAIELDSALADAQIVMGAADEYEERYDKSEERYRRALQLEPASVDAHHWFGYMLLSLGRMEEATTHLRQAERLDPLAKSPASAVGQALLHARRFDEAEKHARRLLELDSTYSLALLGLASSQLGAGRPDSAIATLERLRQVDPRSPVPYPTLVLAYGMAGRWRDADRLREELRSRRASEMETTLAFADLVFGDRRPMVRLAGSREGRRRLLGMLGTFGCNPLLDPLWDDRTFRDALSRTGVRPCDLPRAWSAPPRS